MRKVNNRLAQAKHLRGSDLDSQVSNSQAAWHGVVAY